MDYAPDIRPYLVERTGPHPDHPHARQPRDAGAYFARDRAEALRHAALHTWTHGPGTYTVQYRDEYTGEYHHAGEYLTDYTHDAARVVPA